MIFIDQSSFLPWSWHIAPSTELRHFEQRRGGSGPWVGCEQWRQHMNNWAPCLALNLYLHAAAAEFDHNDTSGSRMSRRTNPRRWCQYLVDQWSFVYVALQGHDQMEDRMWTGWRGHPAPASAISQPCWQGQLLLGCHFGKPGPCSSACSYGSLAGPVNTALLTMCYGGLCQPVPNCSFAQACLPIPSASSSSLLGPLIPVFLMPVSPSYQFAGFLLRASQLSCQTPPQHLPGRTVLSVLRGDPDLAFANYLMLTPCLISTSLFFLLYVNCKLDTQLCRDATYLLWS